MSFSATSFRPYTRAGWGGRAASHFRGKAGGTVVFRSPGGYANFRLSGVTRDSSGTLLGSCVVDLFLTNSDVLQLSTTSDASGNFQFDIMPSGPYYIVAYKSGSPDVAGTTVNTLTPSSL